MKNNEPQHFFLLFHITPTPIKPKNDLILTRNFSTFIMENDLKGLLYTNLQTLKNKTKKHTSTKLNNLGYL
jgi:hypothetical protein